MLVYVDCSGNPKPTDTNAYSALAGVVMRERDSSYITRELYKLKV